MNLQTLKNDKKNTTVYKKQLFFFITIITITLSGCQLTASDITLTDVEAHRNYIDKKGKEAVLTEYENLVKINPNSEFALYYLARCISDIQREKSNKLLEKSLRINPNFYYSNHLLGSVLIEEKNYTEGFKFIENAIKIDSNKYFAYWGMGKYFYYKGLDEEDPESKLKLLQDANKSFKKFEELNGLKDMSTQGDISSTYNDILEKITEEIKEAKSSIDSFYGRYINSNFIYDIKRDGTYSFYVQELNLQNLSQNEVLLTDYDKLPKIEILKGNGNWTKRGNTISLNGPGLSNEYILKYGSLCEYNIYKNDEVCYEKQNL